MKGAVGEERLRRLVLGGDYVAGGASYASQRRRKGDDPIGGAAAGDGTAKAKAKGAVGYAPATAAEDAFSDGEKVLAVRSKKAKGKAKAAGGSYLDEVLGRRGVRKKGGGKGGGGGVGLNDELRVKYHL